MDTAELDYHLPRELIAQEPLPERSASRLLVLRRASGGMEHRRFRELPELLSGGELMVVNDARVLPARVYGRRLATGGRVEVFFLRARAPRQWEVLTRCGGKLKVLEELSLGQRGLRVRLAAKGDMEQGDLLELPEGADGFAFLEEEGLTPLPPYITRPARAEDRERYQTVYAAREGAVAAPTAGLHFSPEVLAQLERRGIARLAITLYLGPGSFRPIKSARVEEHRLSPEEMDLSPQAAAAINEARGRGRKLLAVGTSVVRALEGSLSAEGLLLPGRRESRLFIYPPFTFRVVDMLLTNYHLPRSSLLALVAAFAGRDLILAAYREAVRLRYRFTSYGDAMLIV